MRTVSLQHFPNFANFSKHIFFLCSVKPRTWTFHGSRKFEDENNQRNSNWRAVNTEIKNKLNAMNLSAFSITMSLIIALTLQIGEFTTFTVAPVVSLALLFLAFGVVTLAGGMLVALVSMI